MIFYVDFARFNDNDIECAEDNFPNIPKDQMLIKQFMWEFYNIINLPYKYINTKYSEEWLYIRVEIETPENWDMKKLVKHIQEKCFDHGGMTGEFEVLVGVEYQKHSVFPNPPFFCMKEICIEY